MEWQRKESNETCIRKISLGFLTPLTFLLPIAFALLTIDAVAQESVKSKGRLSDRDFYRAVACAAPPGGACQKKILRWPNRKAKNLSLRVVKTDGQVTRKRSDAAVKAIQAAIAQINAVNSSVKIRIINSGKPDISVVLTKRRVSNFEGNPRSVDDIFLRGAAVGLAEVFTERGSSEIKRARVTLATEMEDKFLKALALEEIVQSLGLLTDIHNRYYHNRSIFSETGSNVRRLKGQDARVIEMHYPL